jgi:hypothetical protein
MHSYHVIFTPRAIKQIQATVDYYNSLQNGLGKRFIQDLKRQLSSVRQHPFSRAIRYDDIRFAVLDKFPYAAHYNIEDDMIIVYGVLSMFQDPENSWIGNK